MTEINQTKAGFAAREPVIVGGVVTWLFSVLGTFLIGHTHWVTNDTWTGLATLLVPIVSALVITGIAWVVRTVVTPVWKVISAQLNKSGVPQEQLLLLVREAVATELAALSHQLPAAAPAVGPVVNIVAGETPNPTP
jgi:hypothetical protein